MHTLYKVYSNRTSEGPVVDGVCNVAPIIGQPASDVMIHAPTRSQYPVSSPPNGVVE